MALYGGSRDVALFLSINRELLHSVIEQQCGYYKVNLEQTTSNLYGESSAKMYNDPVLLYCLIERPNNEFSTDDFGPDNNQQLNFQFLKEDLVDANVFPEVGDVVMWQENYYELSSEIENQLVLGKDPNYALTDYLSNFGTSLSIIMKGNWIRPDKVNIVKTRL